MASAKLLSAFVALGVVLAADAQSSVVQNCQPCTKILMPVCGVDEDEETRTFPNSCELRRCNCLLRAADADRSFKELKQGQCDRLQSNETEIPECYPELEATTERADDGPTLRTLNMTEAAAAAGALGGPGGVLAATMVVAAAASALLPAGGV